MNRIGSSMRNKNSTSFIKSELFIIIINNFNNFDFHPNLAINYSTKWNFLLAKKMKFAVTSQNVWQIQLFINVFFIFFIFIGATSNDLIAPPICQVSEIYSKRSDLISLAKVEVGSLALVDFCRIFGSSWFQSFNVFVLV